MLVTAASKYESEVYFTKDTLRVDRPWRIQPDATSEYCVGATYAENAFFANLNNTPCRMSLWLNCLANVVEKHRDVFAGGIDIWGGCCGTWDKHFDRIAFHVGKARREAVGA